MNFIFPSGAIALAETTTHSDWLLQRRDGIGGSDCSTICGLNPWESAFSLWQQKTGRAPLDLPKSDTAEERMMWGNIHEPAILAETARRLGITITKPTTAFHHPDRPWQRVNLDGWTSDNRIFEAKTTDARNRTQWVGQIPDHAELQVHHAAAVTGATHAIVACLIGGNELVIHEITINPTIVAMLTEREAEFWRHVQDDTEPPIDDSPATMDAITSAWPGHPDAIEVDENTVSVLVGKWSEAVADEKAAATRKRAALAEITALMGGHDRIVTGKHVWAKAQRGQLAMKKLEAAHPDLVAQFTRPEPTFDRAAFRAAHPDIYTKFQTVSIRPQA